MSPTPGALDARAGQLLRGGLDSFLPFPAELISPLAAALATGASDALLDPAKSSLASGLEEVAARFDDALGIVLAGDEAVPLSALVSLLLSFVATSGRMPRMRVYLPEEFYEQVKRRGLPASELLHEAVRAELPRQDLLTETDRYLADLVAEVGEPGPEGLARAESIARRISRRAQRRAEPEDARPRRGRVSRLAERPQRAAALISGFAATVSGRRWCHRSCSSSAFAGTPAGMPPRIGS